jgi:Ca-activated chloride channel homolog
MERLIVAGLVSVGLLATPSVMNPSSARSVLPRPQPDDGAWPVRCNRDDEPADYKRTVQPRSRRHNNVAPPPVFAPSSPPPKTNLPPPPPGIVAPSPLSEASDAVATGAMRASPYAAQNRVRIAPLRDVAPTRERYAGKDVSPIHAVAEAPVSTFSVDVDTGAYANVRRMLGEGRLPPAEAVRTEELLNYFRYDYPRPQDRMQPFSVTTDVSRTPWNESTRLLRIGLRGYDVSSGARPPANLVFLVDVSGSMGEPDKLPLVKKSLQMLAERLNPRDRVSIVVYAGAAGMVLAPTNDKRAVNAALDCLDAGGSTAGGQGIALAYDVARRNMIPGGINRVVLATDGDFNVGMASDNAMVALVKKNRDDGITLTTLGFGTGNYNESMMEKIADVGNGNYSYIDSEFEAGKVLDDELSATLFTIAKDVKMQVEFNPAVVSQYRLIGYENRALAEEDFNNDTVDAGDIGAGHQVTALYEIVPTGNTGWLPERRYEANRVAGQGNPGGEAAWLKLRYKLPGGGASKLIETPVGAALLRNAGLPRGDMAFAVAVAAYGQRLRGDKYLGGFSFADARRLAGEPRDMLRQQFVSLTRAAETARPAS